VIFFSFRLSEGTENAVILRRELTAVTIPLTPHFLINLVLPPPMFFMNATAAAAVKGSLHNETVLMDNCLKTMQNVEKIIFVGYNIKKVTAINIKIKYL
jgi:hypothetical protein